jgi:hypothetical protein
MSGNKELRGVAAPSTSCRPGDLDVILDELRPALRASIVVLAECLLGPPNKRRRPEWRWGSKGGSNGGRSRPSCGGRPTGTNPTGPVAAIDCAGC